jgi:hypothetical protein
LPVLGHSCQFLPVFDPDDVFDPIDVFDTIDCF